MRFSLRTTLSREECLERLRGATDEVSLNGLMQFLSREKHEKSYFMRERRGSFFLTPQIGNFSRGVYCKGRILSWSQGTEITVSVFYHRLLQSILNLVLLGLSILIFFRAQLVGISILPEDPFLFLLLILWVTFAVFWLGLRFEKRRERRRFIKFLKKTLDITQRGWESLSL